MYINSHYILQLPYLVNDVIAQRIVFTSPLTRFVMTTTNAVVDMESTLDILMVSLIVTKVILEVTAVGMISSV